jgi:hypothetical protein
MSNQLQNRGGPTAGESITKPKGTETGNQGLHDAASRPPAIPKRGLCSAARTVKPF